MSMSMHVHSTRRARRVSAALLAGAALTAGIPVTPAWALSGCGSGGCGLSGPPAHPPTSKDQCKDGGWQTFTDAQGNTAFKNQGDCVSYVASNGHSDPGPSSSPQFPTNPG